MMRIASLLSINAPFSHASSPYITRRDIFSLLQHICIFVNLRVLNILFICASSTYLHFIFSSWVPRVRRTSTAKTSLNERPLEEYELLE